MSNVPKLQQALKTVQAARARVAELAKGGSASGARVKATQIRDNYLAKYEQQPPVQKGGQETRIDDRGSSTRPSRGNSVRGKSNKMVSNVARQMSSLELVQNIAHSHSTRQSVEHPYDKEPESMPVAYGVKANLLNPVADDRLESVMTRYGPGVKMRGKEFLSVITSDVNTYGGGNSIIAIPINPRLLQLPRLSIMSKLYTRFLFNKFNLHYHKSAGTQNNGSLQIFGVYDPTINPCARPGETLIAYAAQRGSTDLALYQDAVLSMDDSHFKDLLFLNPDDDLRWTMQGVVFVIASGAIVANLEAGKIMLEYEITLCNDDLEQTESIAQRNYRNVTTTFSTTPTAGSGVTATPGVGIPNGKYFVALRNDPTVSFQVYQDTDAWLQTDVTKLFTMQKGSGYYAVVAAGVVRFLYGPDLYSEDSSSTSFEKRLIHNGYTGTPACVADYYRFADV